MESYSSALRSWLLNFIELKKCWSLIRFFLYIRRAEQLELYDSQKFRKREYFKIYDWVNSGMKYVSLAVFWTLKKYTQRWLYSRMVMVKRNVKLLLSVSYEIIVYFPIFKGFISSNLSSYSPLQFRCFTFKRFFLVANWRKGNQQKWTCHMFPARSSLKTSKQWRCFV